MLKSSSAFDQKGVGLMEVLVALLLLSIAVLGYVALQTRAISASREAVVKTQALSVMRSLAESIRTNNTVRNSYLTQVNGYLTLPSTGPTNCQTTLCNTTQVATYDAYHSAVYAQEFGLKVGMAQCPGVVTGSTYARQCLFTVWGDTTLSVTDNVLNYSNCMNATTGVYVAGSSCLMMEIY